MERILLLVNLIETYLELNEAEQARYRQRLTAERRTAVETLELTWGERKVKEGLERGREQGREQGLAEGLLRARRADVLDVLNARFGTVSDELTARINQTDVEQLTLLLRLAVQVERIEDMRA